MKMTEACELARDCGMTTVDEAYCNVAYHLGNLFPYPQGVYELDELKRDFDLIPDKMMSINDYMNGGSC